MDNLTLLIMAGLIYSSILFWINVGVCNAGYVIAYGFLVCLFVIMLADHKKITEIEDIQQECVTMHQEVEETAPVVEDISRINPE